LEHGGHDHEFSKNLLVDWSSWWINTELWVLKKSTSDLSKKGGGGIVFREFCRFVERLMEFKNSYMFKGFTLFLLQIMVWILAEDLRYFFCRSWFEF
jgi:hypothetical protein